MSVTLYGTTGSYGNFAKDVDDVRYCVYPEPKVIWDYKKKVDAWDIPMEMHPWIQDPYTQVRTITLKGILHKTTANMPPGVRYLSDRMEDFDKTCSYNVTWSAQPTVDLVQAEVLCLGVIFPDSGNYEKLAFVVPQGLNFVYENNNLTYTANFVEASTLMIL